MISIGGRATRAWLYQAMRIQSTLGLETIRATQTDTNAQTDGQTEMALTDRQTDLMG